MEENETIKESKILSELKTALGSTYNWEDIDGLFLRGVFFYHAQL